MAMISAYADQYPAYNEDTIDAVANDMLKDDVTMFCHSLCGSVVPLNTFPPPTSAPPAPTNASSSKRDFGRPLVSTDYEYFDEETKEQLTIESNSLSGVTNDDTYAAVFRVVDSYCPAGVDQCQDLDVNKFLCIQGEDEKTIEYDEESETIEEFAPVDVLYLRRSKYSQKVRPDPEEGDSITTMKTIGTRELGASLLKESREETKEDVEQDKEDFFEEDTGEVTKGDQEGDEIVGSTKHTEQVKIDSKQAMDIVELIRQRSSTRSSRIDEKTLDALAEMLSSIPGPAEKTELGCQVKEKRRESQTITLEESNENDGEATGGGKLVAAMATPNSPYINSDESHYQAELGSIQEDPSIVTEDNRTPPRISKSSPSRMFAPLFQKCGDLNVDDSSLAPLIRPSCLPSSSLVTTCAEPPLIQRALARSATASNGGKFVFGRQKLALEMERLEFRKSISDIRFRRSSSYMPLSASTLTAPAIKSKSMMFQDSDAPPPTTSRSRSLVIVPNHQKESTSAAAPPARSPSKLGRFSRERSSPLKKALEGGTGRDYQSMTKDDDESSLFEGIPNHALAAVSASLKARSMPTLGWGRRKGKSSADRSYGDEGFGHEVGLQGDWEYLGTSHFNINRDEKKVVSDTGKEAKKGDDDIDESEEPDPIISTDGGSPSCSNYPNKKSFWKIMSVKKILSPHGGRKKRQSSLLQIGRHRTRGASRHSIKSGDHVITVGEDGAIQVDLANNI